MFFGHFAMAFVANRAKPHLNLGVTCATVATSALGLWDFVALATWADKPRRTV